MKKIVLIIALLLLVGCIDKKKYIEWKLLFKFDGCYYYEFMIDSKPSYFADCQHKLYKDIHNVEVF